MAVLQYALMLFYYHCTFRKEVESHDRKKCHLSGEGRDAFVCSDRHGDPAGGTKELYLNMRFLDVALSNLRFVPDGQIRGLGTDGNNLYFQPDGVVALFRKGRPVINRAYLHSIVHCLFCHLWNRKDRDAEYWNLACDIAAESIIDDLYLKAVHVPKRQVRREYYRKLKKQGRCCDSGAGLSVSCVRSIRR